MTKAVHAVVATISAVLLNTGPAAAQEMLGFGVIAGQTLTNTGPTTITGDIALYPGTAFTGFEHVTQTGSTFLGDAVALRMQNDLATLYTALAHRPTSQGGDLTGQDLDGMILHGGVYNFDTSAGIAENGTLTLDGGGNPDTVFVFNIGSTFIAESGSKVVLQNGAQGGNVFYRVGSSATLDTSASLEGQIVALTSITMNTAADITCGAALARNGAVTLDTNTIQVCTLAGQGFDTALLTAQLNDTQQAVLDALAGYGGTLPVSLAILPATQTPTELAASLTQLSGEVSAAVAPMGLHAMTSFLDTVARSGRTPRFPAAARHDDRVPVGMVPDKINTPYSGKYGSEPVGGAAALSYPARAEQPSAGWDLWAAAYGASISTDADTARGFQEAISTNRGIAIGLNHAASERTSVGVAVSWNTAGLDLDGGQASGDGTAVLVAVRGRTATDRGYVEGALGYGHGDITTNRTVTIAGVDQFRGEAASDTVAAHVEAGYHFGAVTPFVGLRAQSFRTEGYSETTETGSSSYALNRAAATTTSLRSELGVDMAWGGPSVAGGASSFGIRAAWAHEFAENDPGLTSFQSVPDVQFPISADARDRDFVILSANIGVAAANGVSVDASVNMEYSANSSGYGGALRVGYRW